MTLLLSQDSLNLPGFTGLLRGEDCTNREEASCASSGGWGEDSRRSFCDKYDLGFFLNSGSYGSVWACTEKATGEKFACKVFDKGTRRAPEALWSLKAEVAAMERLAQGGPHPGVVQLREALQGSRAAQMVMEFCSGGDLFDLIRRKGPMPKPAAQFVFCQLAAALDFCHGRGVLHRDIKPENILFDLPADSLYSMSSSSAEVPRVQAKLADFGLSLVLEPGQLASGKAGSKFYTAPEIVQGKRYGEKADVWSLGVVLCVMLTGRMPFCGRTNDDDEGLRRAILRGRVAFHRPCWDGVSPEARLLVCRMLALAPGKRLSAADLLSQSWCCAGPLGARWCATAPVGAPEAQGGRQAARESCGAGADALQGGLGALPLMSKSAEEHSVGREAAREKDAGNEARTSGAGSGPSAELSTLRSNSISHMPLLAGDMRRRTGASCQHHKHGHAHHMCRRQQGGGADYQCHSPEIGRGQGGQVLRRLLGWLHGGHASAVPC